MWGIVPSIEVGGLAQPEVARDLAPLGGASPGEGGRPRVLGDHVVDRLAAAGVRRLCFVVPQQRLEVAACFGAEAAGIPVAYVVQPRPLGLCDAIFRALPLLRPEDLVAVARPASLWFPEQALRRLGYGALSFLCFPSAEPGRFEAVVASDDGEVRSVCADRPGPGVRWVWGAFQLDGATLRALHELWCARGRSDRELGPLVTAWIAAGGMARAVKAGEILVDCGTDAGMREAASLLSGRAP
jgi:dTDP-glucose pyrophosphorylase